MSEKISDPGSPGCHPGGAESLSARDLKAIELKYRDQVDVLFPVITWLAAKLIDARPDLKEKVMEMLEAAEDKFEATFKSSPAKTLPATGETRRATQPLNPEP